MIVTTIALALMATTLYAAAPNAGASWTWSWEDEWNLGATVSQAAVVGAPDGTVYIMGGFLDMTTAAVSSAYAYDSETGAWTVLASMDAAARGAAGAMGQDGRVYVFGSQGMSSYTQIYDPEADDWTLGATMPYGVWEAKAATISNGSIWVVGGYGAPSGAVQIYDPVADAWSLGPSAPEAVMCGAMVSVGDDLYYSGGCDGDWFEAMPWFLKFDSVLGTWTTLSDLPEPIAGHSMVVGADGLIYTVGGSDNGVNTGDGYAFDMVMAYDVAADEWSYASSMDYARTYLGATVTSDGRILALGGNDGVSVLANVESLQLYLFDYSMELSSPSVRAGESVLLTVDGQFTYVEEYYNELAWFLVSADDGTMYEGDYVWYSSADPIAISIEVPAAAPAGDYLVVIDYWYLYVDNANEYVEGLEVALEVLPAAEPTDALIADLEAQIADLQTQLNNLSDANEALMDEIAALQDQIDTLKATQDETSQDVSDVQTSVDDKLSAMMGYAILGLLIVVVVLLIVMMVMGRKSAPPPAP